MTYYIQINAERNAKKIWCNFIWIRMKNKGVIAF